jgi:hypothetical protein
LAICYEIFRFRPAAFGFPTRGDDSFAARTISSNSAFGTARDLFMPALKLANSDVLSNRLPVMGGGCVDSAPVISFSECLSAISLYRLSSQLIVHEALADDLAHAVSGPVNVREFAIIVSEHLLVKIPEKVKGFDRNIGSVYGSTEMRS